MKKLLSVCLLGLSFGAMAQVSPTANYRATDLNMSEAKRAFSMLKKGDAFKSICSNRAMVWAHQMETRLSIQSKKIYIHFTDAFNHIIDNDVTDRNRLQRIMSGGSDGWEYHVASSVLVDGKDYAMDRKFMKAPVTAAQWEDHFVARANRTLNSKASSIIAKLHDNIKKNKKRAKKGWTSNSKRIGAYRVKRDQAALALINSARREDGKYEVKCKQITHITEHDNDQESSWCHIQFSNMYHWNQKDLRNLANGGNSLHNFSEYQVEQSYKQAFKGSEREAMGF